MVTLQEQLVEQMPVGVSVFEWEDRDDLGSFRIVWRNAAAESNTGVSSEVVGTTLKDAYTRIMDTELPRLMGRAVETGRIQRLARLPYADARVRAGVFHHRIVPLGGSTVAVFFERLDDEPMERQVAHSRDQILVVEDDWIVARAIQQTLQSAGYEVTAVVSSPDEALASVANRQPRVAIVDVKLRDGTDGIELARQLAERTGAQIVYISASSDAATVARVAATHPSGFILKPFQEEQMLTIVAIAIARRKAEAGTGHESSSATGAPERRPASDPGDGGPARFARVADALSLRTRSTNGATELTSRELDIVRLLLSNGRVRSIARDLDLSQHTVRNHLRSIFRKLDVHSQDELIRELTQRTGS